MIRQTSAETYRQIKDEGLITKLEWVVYKALYEHGPATCREIVNIVCADGYVKNVSPRFSKLRDRGVFTELGTKVCSVSGRTSILWDVTSKLPVKFERPQKAKCKACQGKGYVVEQQGRLF